VTVHVATPAGKYALVADWFVDATGANSRIRDAMGLAVNASRGTDRWCITDVRFHQAVRDRALDLDRRAVQRGPRRLAAPDGRRPSGASTTR